MKKSSVDAILDALTIYCMDCSKFKLVRGSMKNNVKIELFGDVCN